MSSRSVAAMVAQTVIQFNSKHCCLWRNIAGSVARMMRRVVGVSASCATANAAPHVPSQIHGLGNCTETSTRCKRTSQCWKTRWMPRTGTSGRCSTHRRRRLLARFSHPRRRRAMIDGLQRHVQKEGPQEEIKGALFSLTVAMVVYSPLQRLQAGAFKDTTVATPSCPPSANKQSRLSPPRGPGVP